MIYAEVIKRGLPRRYDRLHDNLEQMADVFDIVLLFEYLFYIMALLVRNGHCIRQTSCPPVHFIGLALFVDFISDQWGQDLKHSLVDGWIHLLDRTLSASNVSGKEKTSKIKTSC